MGVIITDEQHQEIMRYLTDLRNGDAFAVMNNHTLNSKLANFMATLPGGTPPSRENDEEIIRRNLLIWSQPSCP